MKWGITLLTVTLVVLFAFVSGCANTSLGSAQVAEFGKSADAQKAQDWFISQYGNPATYTGSPRFLEPMVSSGVIDNTPTDKVLKFSKDTPSVYFWVIYEGFAKGDPVTATWTYQGKQYATLSKQVAGNYGAINARFDKPSSGWALGTHTITISGGGAQNSVTFEIIAGSTVTAPLPYEMAPPFRIINQSGSGNTTPSGMTTLNPDRFRPIDPPIQQVTGTIPVTIRPFDPDLRTREVTVAPRINPALVPSRSDVVAQVFCGSSICPSDQICQDGTCMCEGGKTLCGDQCLDLNTDPKNCGSCGTRCPVFGSGQMKCVEGTCTG